MKNKKVFSALMISVTVLFLAVFMAVPGFAAEETTEEVTAQAILTETQSEAEAEESDILSSKAFAAALAVGIVGAAGAIGMAIAISKSTDSMARQPEASSKINSAMMLGLVFIETVIIYALIVAILIIFVL